MRTILSLLIFFVILSAEEVKPDVAAQLAEAKEEIALLRARVNWCSQEIDIWKRNIPVMEVRLELARQEAKAAEREKASKAKPAPASSGAAPAQ